MSEVAHRPLDPNDSALGSRLICDSESAACATAHSMPRAQVPQALIVKYGDMSSVRRRILGCATDSTYTCHSMVRST